MSYTECVEPNKVRAKNLRWDKQNREHIAKHNVTPRHVETALLDEGRIFRDSYSGRFSVTAKMGKRMLFIVFAKEADNKFYTVSARDASKVERKIYRGGSMNKKIKKLPKFKSDKEEAEFWDNNSFLDYSFPISGDTPIYMPDGGSKVQMSIRVDRAFRDSVKKVAKKTEIPVSTLIRKWSVEGLRRMGRGA